MLISFIILMIYSVKALELQTKSSALSVKSNLLDELMYMSANDRSFSKFGIKSIIWVGALTQIA